MKWAGPGVLEVMADGEVIYSRQRERRPISADELMQRIAAAGQGS